MDSHTLGDGDSHKHLVLGLMWQIIAVSYLLQLVSSAFALLFTEIFVVRGTEISVVWGPEISISTLQKFLYPSLQKFL